MTSWMPRAALAVVLAAAGILVAARRMLVLVTVRGESMTPTFDDGDRLVAVSRPGWLTLRRGWVVCGPLRGPLGRVVFGGATQVADGLYVKRVVAGPGDPLPVDAGDTAARGDAAGAAARIAPGRWFLRGDNPGSGDSRHWGLVPDAEVTAVVLGRLGRSRPSP